MKFKSVANNLYDRILSKEAKLKFEKVIFVTALGGFLFHLALIMLIQWGIIPSTGGIRGLESPIDAIYTPFSIILFYEVYCLVYYLPKSITTYIGKQFEIIALITIRGIFDELSHLELSSDVFDMLGQPDFMYSMATILLLFGLIYFFYRLNQRGIREENNLPDIPAGISDSSKKYIYGKRVLAMSLGILFIVLALTNLYEWFTNNHTIVDFIVNTKPATKSFFSVFFTVLILNDVIVLLFSFAITDEFHKVMRNSGFVISTTLLKLSFNVEGLASHLMIILGVAFGTAILAMYKLYKKIDLPED